MGERETLHLEMTVHDLEKELESRRQVRRSRRRMLDERRGRTGTRPELSMLENLRVWVGPGEARGAMSMLPDPRRPVSSHWLPL